MDQLPKTAGFEADIDAVSRIPAVPAILKVICRMTGMGFAAVARVTDGHWIACSVLDEIDFGLQPGEQLRVETTICSEVRDHGSAVVIGNVADDPVYCGHPTPAMYGFQSYVSIPIVLPDGTFFGTLCAIDPKPRALDKAEVIDSFKLFAELIALHLDMNLRLVRSEAKLLREQEIAELREQFIAVLGHDLRNPLAAVAAGTRMLVRRPERAAEIAPQMQRSIHRMAGLIDNVLDFARGRLGGGLAITRDTEMPLEPVLHQVVEELRASHPGRTIETEFQLGQPVECDRQRMGQLLSNLLGNALTHGLADEAVRVCAHTDGGQFELSVSNRGELIPPVTLRDIFQPFFRGKNRNTQEGLGLGLYICSEIAKAHGGTLHVGSTQDGTCFTLRMPVQA